MFLSYTLSRGSTATGLVGLFPVITGVTGPGSVRILLPQKGASIAPAAETSAFRTPALLHCAPSVGGVRLLFRRCLWKKDSRKRVSPLRKLLRRASRPLGVGFVTGLQKSQIKNELIQTTLPAFAIPFTAFRDVRPVGRCGQTQRSDLCKRTLRHQSACPTEDWVPPTFTVLPAKLDS